MHRFSDDGRIVAKLQNAELDYLMHSEAGMRTFAENMSACRSTSVRNLKRASPPLVRLIDAAKN